MSKKTLLLVDDERDSLEPMTMLLEEEYRVLTANGGEEALSALLEHPAVEIIIADQRMPGLTGVELLARVRELYPTVVRLILTAYTDFDAMLQAINQGRVYRYIIKPWDPEDMRVTIRQALEWKQLQAAHGQLTAEIAEANRTLAERNRELEAAQETIIEQEKLAVVGRFAREIAHEINNHLAVMINIPEELRANRQRELELLHQADQVTGILRGLAHDIGDFAAGQPGETSRAFTDPVRLAREVMQTCRRHPAFRGVELQLDADPVKPCQLDQRQLKQMLLNLMKNAATAAGDGGQVMLQVRSTDEHLELRVIDNGPGIPMDRRERVFEPFFTTGGDDSMGLGLAISRRLAANHGGDIAIGDAPGGGAVFTISLPR